MGKNIEYGMVDLGLPSGLKWSDRNVGAQSPEDFGDYFAWGETAQRGENWATEAHYDWAHAPFNGGATAFNETYFDSVKDTVCPGGALASEYDAAHVQMGDSWRMPTLEEIQELVDGTTQTVEEVNGIAGVRFTSNANGNSIFMPFAGCRYGSYFNFVGYNGYAWSSSLDAGGTYRSHGLGFYGSVGADVECDIRYYGSVVRGVHV